MPETHPDISDLARGTDYRLQVFVEEGETLALLRLIEHKFGAEAKEACRERVEQAKAQELALSTERILDAERVEDVFAEG